MKTAIFYYSGTGNSLWIARKLQSQLADSTLFSMSQKSVPAEAIASADTIGLIFPVYIWGVPGAVLDFLKSLYGAISKGPKYTFAIAVNAGQVSRTLIQLKDELATHNIKLSIGISIVMPSNYIPWGGPGSVARQAELFKLATTRISEIAPSISSKQTLKIEHGPRWQCILFTLIYKLSFKRVHQMDKKFWSDDRCNGCSICTRVCPTRNIHIDEHNQKPVWQNRCHQCLACIQWCPQFAIQYGKRTTQYARYHHPEVSLSDIIRRS